jgi:hypothetical protein
MQTGIYEHYKGNRYEVIGTAIHSETLEEMVVYRNLYHSPNHGYGALWVRPKTMFEEETTVNGQTVKRFTFVE